jgi:hypothetical protein
LIGLEREKHKSFEIQWLRVPSSIVIDIHPKDHFEKENISGSATTSRFPTI